MSYVVAVHLLLGLAPFSDHFRKDRHHFLSRGVSFLVGRRRRPREEDGERREAVVEALVNARDFSDQIGTDLIPKGGRGLYWRGGEECTFSFWVCAD